MKVYTYWECAFCPSIIRGDSRTCPNCGAPIPNNVKYLMPDNPKVIQAKREGKILIGEKSSTFTDENSVVAEIVPKDKERTEQNWLCPSCGYQNFAESETCAGCGADKSTLRYFDDNDADTTPKRESAFDRVEDKRWSTQPENDESEPNEPPKKTIWDKLYDSISCIPLWLVLTIIAGFILVPLCIWFFSPVARIATVEGFRWEQRIEVEEYQLCHESGWSVPAGGRTTRTAQEIHHYDTVLDHYETKSRQVSEQVFDGYDTEYRTVSEQVFDGYDTSYRDLGNGQADVVQTPRYRTEYHTESYQVPRYRTEWHTEYYDEPVYVDVPVYQTKYYYDIDRWIHVDTLVTSENDHEPYWYETEIPEEVDEPNYGDLRLGSKSGTYYVILQNDEGSYELTYGLDEWNEFAIGDELRYESFRFSYIPLTDTEVIHKKNN